MGVEGEGERGRGREVGNEGRAEGGAWKVLKLCRWGAVWVGSVHAKNVDVSINVKLDVGSKMRDQ